MEKIKIVVRAAIPGYEKGQVVMVEVDENQTPIKRFWRRRLADAKTDHCIEIVAPPKKPVKTKLKSEESTS